MKLPIAYKWETPLKKSYENVKKTCHILVPSFGACGYVFERLLFRLAKAKSAITNCLKLWKLQMIQKVLSFLQILATCSLH